VPGYLKSSIKLAIVVRAGSRADIYTWCCRIVLPGDTPEIAAALASNRCTIGSLNAAIEIL
jgi:hypothetical protein